MFEKITKFLFPNVCIFCKAKNTSLCGKCFFAIPKFPVYKNNIYSYYRFHDKKVAELVKDLKYYHNGEVAKKFGKVLAGEISKIVPENSNIFLIPIPLNNRDLRLHNHAELICKSIQIDLPNSKILNLLNKNSKKQQNKTSSKKERLENIKNAFTISAKGCNFVAPPDSVFIIIDDVTTTGATINEARKLLEKFVNQKVLAYTVAY